MRCPPGSRRQSRRRATAPRAGIVLLSLLALPSLAAAETRNLDECIAIALANKPSLKATSAVVQGANQRVWQSVSGYLPQVSATHETERRKASLGSSTSTNVNCDTVTGLNCKRSVPTFNFFTAGVSFSQTLFDWGRQLAEIRAAQANERSLEADRDTQLENVVFDVKQSYFDLLAAQRLATVAAQTLAQNRTLLDEADSRYEVGMAPRFDVTRARVQLAGSELDQLTASNNVELARETLRNALGLNGPLGFNIADTLDVTAVNIDEQTALSTAYSQRPELRSIDEQRNAVQLNVEALKRDYLPSVTGSGSYTWSGSEDPLQDSWAIGAAINLSLFNGGLTTAQIGEQRARLSELDYNRQTMEQSIALEVRQAVINLNQARQKIEVSRAGRDEARENLEIALGRYRGGVGNIIELTDAQTSSTTADATYVQALYEHQIALASLEKAMGRPVEPLAPKSQGTDPAEGR